MGLDEGPKPVGTGTVPAQSDAVLVQAALAGRRRALESLIERHHRRILRMTTALARDEHAGEDLAQEVFLRACRTLASCARPDRFGQWLDGIARNCVREWFRGRGESVSLDALGPDEGPSAPSLREVGERLDALERGLESLPGETREIVLLKYRDGLTCAEIAARFGKKTNTVAQALARAYERLEKAVRKTP